MYQPTNRTCRVPACAGAPMQLVCASPDRQQVCVYCDAHWKTVVATLERTITVIARTAKELYIGRSCYPERRLLQHRETKGLACLAVLHWASDWTEIASLEEAMIEHGSRWVGKGLNQSENSDGRYSGAWNALYVAWNRKRGGKRQPGSRLIESLEYSDRMWPVSNLMETGPVPLHTVLKRDVAGELARARWAGRRAGRRGQEV